MIKTLKKITIACVAIVLLIGSFLLSGIICEPCATLKGAEKGGMFSASEKSDFSIEDLSLTFFDGKSQTPIAKDGASPYFPYNGHEKSFIANNEDAGFTYTTFASLVASDPDFSNNTLFVDIAWGNNNDEYATFGGVEFEEMKTDVSQDVTTGFDQYWICGVVILDKDHYNKPIVQSNGERFPSQVAVDENGDYVVRFFQMWGIKPREVKLVVKDQKSNSFGEAPDMRPYSIVDVIDNITGKKIDIALTDVIDLSGVTTKIVNNKITLDIDRSKIKSNYDIKEVKEGNYTVIVDFMPWIPSIAMGGLALIFFIIFLCLLGKIKKLKS